MPLYKYLGNRVLTTFENAMVGSHLSEWHSGYRAYSVAALREIPFESNSDGFDFDTEVIVQLQEAGKRIVEVPIPTYYGDEICHVNGLGYAKDVAAHVTRYRLHKLGLGSGDLAFASDAYEFKDDEHSSHGRILALLSGRPSSRILDLGCSDGALGERLQKLGHHVTGVDSVELEGVRDRLESFVRSDLDTGVPAEVGQGYDVVVAADVLEHVRRPDRVLDDARRCLHEGGTLIVSVPNFAHWYPRLRVAAGAFDYDRRGILDRGHLRFFTRKSFERLARSHGFAVRRRAAVGIPLEAFGRGGADDAPRNARLRRSLQQTERIGLVARPTLFAYQFVYELQG